MICFLLDQLSSQSRDLSPQIRLMMGKGSQYRKIQWMFRLEVRIFYSGLQLFLKIKLREWLQICVGGTGIFFRIFKMNKT